jgi:hypothetical protein
MDGVSGWFADEIRAISKGKQEEMMNLLCRLLLSLLVCLILFVGCGGGFNENSDNAEEFGDSIFGTDSLIRAK